MTDIHNDPDKGTGCTGVSNSPGVPGIDLPNAISTYHSILIYSHGAIVVRVPADIGCYPFCHK